MNDDLRDRLDDLEEHAGDTSVFAELWKRSAAGEDPLEDAEFRQRLTATVDRDGWPPNPWGNK